MWKYNSSPSLDYLRDAKMKSLRIELGWGVANSFNNCIVCGSNGNITYDYSPLDMIATEMNNRNMRMYWSYAYNPDPLKYCNNDGIGTPCDIVKWGDILKNMSAHWKANGLTPAYQGVWNEPDFTGAFYSGDVNSFKPIYEYGSKGIRAGDADAVVGGPDLAVGDTWLATLLDNIQSTNSPMDFLSYHILGAGNEDRIKPKRDALNARPYFNQTEMMIGELNPYSTTTYHGQASSSASDWPMGSAALDCMNYFIQTPEVTRTFWAQGMDAGGGDALAAITYTGSYRRPVYWAHYFYGLMPVDRVQSTASGVNTFASTDGHTSAIMLWVPQGWGNKTVTATFKNSAFSSGTLNVWRIDATHNSYHNTGHDSDAPEQIQVANTNGYTWTGTIPDGGTVLLQLSDNTGISELANYDMGATLIRQHHLFYNRGDKSYGIFDPSTFIARLGMSGNDYALVEEGALYKNMPAAINIKTITQGNPHALDINSVLSLNLDYRVNGTYTKSVLFHGGLYNSARQTGHSFGKTGLPQQVVQVALSDFTINLADYAPAGWTVGGDILISYTMQNTGANSRAKFTIRKASIPVTTIDTSKYYKIYSKNSPGSFITIADSIVHNGSNIGVAPNTNSDLQIWKIKNIGNGYYAFTSRSNPSIGFDCSAPPVDGTNVQAWTYGGNDRQQWSIQDAGDGFYHIAVMNSNPKYVLDMSGTNVQVWSNAGNDRQEWQFQAVTINTPPTISITSQTGQTLLSPAFVSINTTANDADGSVAKVEFFNGTTKIGESTTAPFSFTWANVAAGSYSITAKATDNNGATTTSAVLTVTVLPTTIWDFTLSINNWNGNHNVTYGNPATIIITGSDPYFYSPDNVNLSAIDYKYIIIKMQNKTNDYSAQFYWNTTTSTGFSDTQMITFAIVPNDTIQRYYILDLSTNPNWTGTIRQIRFDPVATASSGTVILDFIKFAGTYTASTASIPGIIEAENFDLGGQANAYNDADAINYGGQYRLNEAVDIQTTTDVGGGYNVGWITTGEWLEYLINSTATTMYTLTSRVAASTDGNQFHIEVDGIDKTGIITVNATGGVQTYTDFSNDIAISAGLHCMRVFFDKSNGGFNLNKITVAKKSYTQSITLQKGWNIISTNVCPSDSSITTLFSGLDVQEIKTADAFWRKQQNTLFNNLKVIEAGKGYLVNMNVTATLTVTGTPTVKTVPITPLHKGWNIIGCPYQTSTVLSTLFNVTNTKMVKNFNGYWIPNGTTNSIQNLEPDFGYFILNF
jgi:hypothetical protein